ncbi:hypothetical protein [Paraburkholderia acidisoli]|uniref:Uncharacterized protein n=1 Tax=Paraburkholderia acidisoli TaxID=2571748 RepID=A0A7Z2GPT6_9BURK|nr:hypothetical protein [Paraburkholderia acidisoli]QGZ65459.1 hypothetical protein FAZ98_27270 [Paraburkholderia acidisoli]
MTSPIGSSSSPFASALTSTNTNRNSGQTNTGTSTDTPAQHETVHPAPVGPLGHNINTTA